MKLSLRERLLSWGAVLALAGVLIVLAILQYRWSGEVSEATSARMQANLQSSLIGFRQDLSREFARICQEMQPEGTTGTQIDARRYAQQFRHWQQTASHSGLIENIYIWKSNPGPSNFERLDPVAGHFESVDLPQGFYPLRDQLQAMSAILRSLSTHPGVPPGPPIPGAVIEFRRSTRGPAGPVVPWGIDQNIPALIYPLAPRLDSNTNVMTPPSTWIIIKLNTQLLQQHILPELSERHFGGPSGLTYQVAVISNAGGQAHTLYSSDANFGEKPTTPDAQINLWGPPFPSGKRPSALNGPSLKPFHVFLSGPPDSALQVATAGAGPVSSSRDRHDFEFGSLVGINSIHYVAGDGDWQVIVKHRQGSLEAAVAALRRRNLAVSFGILLVLAASMGLIVITSQRAHKLAQLQMDFVTGVSHELRTPLAVISSAAENIADGVVANQKQLARYGAVIKNQAKQLAHLVEQVLLFAATRQARQRYNLRPLQISDVLDAALESTAGLISNAGFVVERQIEKDLPPVAADFEALLHCLQNLITNAVKYGGESRWIGIRAHAANRGRQAEVQVVIEDKGIGISSTDLPHIFEPFYRSPSVASSQIHGTGLGLTLAQSIAEAMGGELSVASEMGRGTSFTVHLPIAHDKGVQPAQEAQMDVVPKFTP